MTPRMLIVPILMILASRPAASGKSCTDPTALAAVRQEAAAACSCLTAASASAYGRCVKTFQRANPTGLDAPCWREFRSCARKSTCGKPGEVTCCSTTVRGAGRCLITSVERCTAVGGCVGSYQSCCDACDQGSCVLSTTTTTLPPPVCGNGTIEPGEGCDGGSFCAAGCQVDYPGCCEFGGGGSFGLHVFLSDSGVNQVCILGGGTWHAGELPSNAVPCPSGNGVCGGPCEPVTLPAPVPLCCAGNGCQETASASGETLTTFIHTCAYSGGINLVEGTCGVTGTCVPAH